MSAIKRLDEKAVLKSRTKLRVVAACVSRDAKEILEGFSSREELLGALRASASIPLATGRPYEYRGHTYLDAAVVESIPWETPYEEGVERILVLTTSPIGQYKGIGVGQRALDSLWIRKLGPELRQHVLGRRDSAAERSLFLQSCADDPESRICVIGPSGSVSVSPMEQDPAVLKAAAVDGFLSMLSAFGVDHPRTIRQDGIFTREET
jgi:predicted patatin/cPLA2 family phospholipase